MFICQSCHKKYAQEEFNCYYRFEEHSKHEVADCQICGWSGRTVLCRAAQRLAEQNKNYWQDRRSKNER